jgi:hypothetical protein
VGCILLRSLLGLYYSGRQSQQSFLLLSPSTYSLHVSTRAGHLQVNIFFEVSYCLHGPKHLVSELKELIIKSFVAIDGHYNKVLISRECLRTWQFDCCFSCILNLVPLESMANYSQCRLHLWFSVRVPGYRSRGPGSIPGATRFSEK